MFPYLPVWKMSEPSGPQMVPVDVMGCQMGTAWCSVPRRGSGGWGGTGGGHRRNRGETWGRRTFCPGGHRPGRRRRNDGGAERGRTGAKERTALAGPQRAARECTERLLVRKAGEGSGPGVGSAAAAREAGRRATGPSGSPPAGGAHRVGGGGASGDEPHDGEETEGENRPGRWPPGAHKENPPLGGLGGSAAWPGPLDGPARPGRTASIVEMRTARSNLDDYEGPRVGSRCACADP